jgi:hypothetical protein
MEIMSKDAELLVDNLSPEAVERIVVRRITDRTGISLEWLAQLTKLKGAARESVMEVCIDLLEEVPFGGIRATLCVILCAPGIERFSDRLTHIFRIEQSPETFESLQVTMLLAFAKRSAEVAALFLERPRILKDSALRFLIRVAKASEGINDSLQRHFAMHEFDLEILLAIARNWPEEYDFLAQVGIASSNRLSAACCTALLDAQVPHEQWYCRRAKAVPFYAVVLLQTQIASVDLEQYVSVLANEHKIELELQLESASISRQLGGKSCIAVGFCKNTEADDVKALIVRRCDGQSIKPVKQHKHTSRVRPNQQMSIRPPERVEVVLIQCPKSPEWNQLPKVLLANDHPIRKFLEARSSRS